MAYLNRVFDLRLKAHLKAMGAVLIEGPNGVAKPPLPSNWPIVLDPVNMN